LRSQKIGGAGYTRESGFSSIGYTCESKVIGVGYTNEFRLYGVAYTAESLVQTSRPAIALKGTIPQKIKLGVLMLSTGYWEEILVLKIVLT
jgi:hypothetical protein